MPTAKMVNQLVRRLYLSAKLTKKKLDLDWIELLLCGHPVKSNGVPITRAFLENSPDFSTGFGNLTFHHLIDDFRSLGKISATAFVLQLGQSVLQYLHLRHGFPKHLLVISLKLRLLRFLSKPSPVDRNLRLRNLTSDRPQPFLMTGIVRVPTFIQPAVKFPLMLW
jgi:hypothetical protein